MTDHTSPLAEGYPALVDFPRLVHDQLAAQAMCQVEIRTINERIDLAESALRDEAYSDPANSNDGQRRAAYKLAVAQDINLEGWRERLHALLDDEATIRRTVGLLHAQLDVAKLVYERETATALA